MSGLRKRTAVASASRPPKPIAKVNDTALSKSDDSSAEKRLSPAPTCYCVTGAWTLLWSCLLGFQVTVLFLLLRPATIEPVGYNLPSPPLFIGALKENSLLSKAVRLAEGAVLGAESLAVLDSHIYSGTADGKIIKINLESGSVIEMARLVRKDCSDVVHDEYSCGRPLGIRIKGDFLYAIDAYYGVYKIDLKNPAALPQLIVNNVTFGNDIDVAADGTLYFTDSSQRWKRRQFPYLLLEGTADGRLLSYNDASGLTVLLGGVAFANGVQLAPSGEYLVIAESARCRILRYYLRGHMKGKVDVFASNLPGVPDNIRLSPRGTYWVGIGAIRGRGGMQVLDWIAPRPWIRYLLAQLLPLQHIGRLIPLNYGLIIELDADGRILKSLHDPLGAAVPSVSEVAERDSDLFLGTYALPFVSRVRLTGMSHVGA